MDGTLVDTEPDWFAAEVDLMDSYGFRLGASERAAMLGNPIPVAIAHLLAVSGLSVPAGELHAALTATMVERLRSRGVGFLPGARELLEQARAADVPTALVTASEGPVVDAVLASIGREWFDAIVTGDDVRHGKPAPDPYLLAASELGVDPAACVVLEDSPTGIAAGRAAGCRVVGVSRVVAVEPGPGLRVVDTLTRLDLPALSTEW